MASEQKMKKVEKLNKSFDERMEENGYKFVWVFKVEYGRHNDGSTRQTQIILCESYEVAKKYFDRYLRDNDEYDHYEKMYLEGNFYGLYDPVLKSLNVPSISKQLVCKD